MSTQQGLDNIRIVLVRTKAPGNIGAVARCMMNTGLSRLVLVRPPADPSGESVKLAVGAGEILDRAEHRPSLREAVSDCGIVVGTSRRRGRLRRNVRTPREMAGLLMPLLARNRVAIVFGSEVDGLERNDLALCQEMIAIPSSGAFPSLNLSHAVMIVAYELFLASPSPLPAPPAEELAPSDELERFYLHLQQVLHLVGFFEEERPDRMMATLRRIFGRSRPGPRDVRVLRGILTRIEQAVRPPRL